MYHSIVHRRVITVLQCCLIFFNDFFLFLIMYMFACPCPWVQYRRSPEEGAGSPRGRLVGSWPVWVLGIKHGFSRRRTSTLRSLAPNKASSFSSLPPQMLGIDLGPFRLKFYHWSTHIFLIFLKCISLWPSEVVYYVL